MGYAVSGAFSAVSWDASPFYASSAVDGKDPDRFLGREYVVARPKNLGESKILEGPVWDTLQYVLGHGA